MPSHHLSVSRTARYHTLGPVGANVRELWIVLHGYAQLAERFVTQLSPLDDGATLIVAPEALSRFYLETGLDGRHGEVVGASWLTREDREADLDDHLGYLDQLGAQLLGALPQRPRVVVLGFSQGSVTAARWVARGAFVPDVLILWGTPLPADVAPKVLGERMAGRTVVLAAGDRDAYVPAGSIEAAAQALQESAVSSRAIRFAGGHLIPPMPLLRAAGRAADEP
jgi:predicted esterase